MTDDVIAQAAEGRLRGARDGEALRFLGIPYARSPATAGRFAAPVPHGRWDGIRDALAYGATSPQPDRGITVIPEPVITGDNELNLNIFTPDLGAAGLPVLVWIHGGGFYGGCNASPWYRGGPFARDGVVLVSINYRLGAEGFLEVPGAPANRAVRDWVRALEWVQVNIAAFGGDPGQVTIAGQSAGGSACAALLGVPAARGLFRSAVCMSGGAALRQTADGVRAVAAQMAKHLGVSALSQAALEELPAETILAAQEAVTAASPGEIGGQKDREAVIGLLSSGIRLPWAPWTDGEVVAEDPLQAAGSPQHSSISLLAGATAHEFNMAWMTADWITADMVAEGLAKAGVPAPLTAAYLDRAGQQPCGAVGQAITDRTFRVPAQQLAAAKAEAGGAAYTYDFRWAASAGPLPGLAFHCLDVPFAFDALGEPGVKEVTGQAPPASLAADMHGSWVRFVTDGDPGWERYETGRRPVMVFAEPSAMREDPLETERAAWGRLTATILIVLVEDPLSWDGVIRLAQAPTKLTPQVSKEHPALLGSAQVAARPPRERTPRHLRALLAPPPRSWAGRPFPGSPDGSVTEAAKCTLCSMDESYGLTAARAHLGELVSRARYGHRPVTITEHGKPSVAIINVDDLADLEDRAALAAHYAARLAGRDGVPLGDLDAALDQIDAEDGR